MALGFLSLVGIISHYLSSTIPSQAAERDLMSPLCFKPAHSYGGVDSLKLISELVPLSRFGQQRVRLMKLLIANAPNPHLFPQAYAQQITIVEPGGIPCYLPIMMFIHSTFSRNWLKYQVLWTLDCAIIHRYQKGNNGLGLWNEAWICLCVIKSVNWLIFLFKD